MSWIFLKIPPGDFLEIGLIKFADTLVFDLPIFVQTAVCYFYMIFCDCMLHTVICVCDCLGVIIMWLFCFYIYILQCQMSVSKTFIVGTLCREFESEVPAAEENLMLVCVFLMQLHLQ